MIPFWKLWSWWLSFQYNTTTKINSLFLTTTIWIRFIPLIRFKCEFSLKLLNSQLWHWAVKYFSMKTCIWTKFAHCHGYFHICWGVNCYTDSVRMPSAVSLPSGVSQVTLAVSFPGSAVFSFILGHLITGGSTSETENTFTCLNTMSWIHICK